MDAMHTPRLIVIVVLAAGALSGCAYGDGNGDHGAAHHGGNGGVYHGAPPPGPGHGPDAGHGPGGPGPGSHP